MRRETILEHLREMVRICNELGSPFTAQLFEKMVKDFDAGGPTAALIDEWPTNPRADFLALRLAGALHAAALTERDSALTMAYPPRNTFWRMEELWPIARTFLQRESAWVAQFLKSPPQTNETGRSIALLAGFLYFADQWDGPVDMLEIGASAGLNLIWDKFSYQTQTWSWGSPGSVLIEADWQGPIPPTDALPRIRRKAACDLNPLDIRIPEERLRLRSYIWPDQPDRLARFDGAVALALESGLEVERANAADWLLKKLSARALDAATIVYHSVFLQYPPEEVRQDIVRTIYDAGAAATSKAPLAWVRVEPEALVDGVADSKRFTIDLTVWPGGVRRIVGHTDGHGRVIHAA